MMKKSIAQKVGSGIIVTAFGYAMKARPGPEKDRDTQKERETIYKKMSNKCLEY